MTLHISSTSSAGDFPGTRGIQPVVFQCEASLWEMLQSGTKPFDMRRFDLGDDRIRRLAHVAWTRDFFLGWVCEYVEKTVHFRNKATGQVLIFRFGGLEFARWAPGWCFLKLSGPVSSYRDPEQAPASAEAKPGKRAAQELQSALDLLDEALSNCKAAATAAQRMAGPESPVNGHGQPSIQ